ncbi:Uncharacterised protein [Serratia marcescens]|nr:hypothetical protein [Serratia marcescens]MBH3280549.1 hypothetical protein [Serratia marcescens]RJY04327.1 hypothetical protein D3I93_11425 [Serratia marcescens]RLO42573.1 hypothetical protein CLM67_21460 [Serratia marcescens]RLO56176.1 hypothetical protein CLM66_01080 [Serratia marcescens]CAI1593452.1 Uncharacterised protein [Serratia marcescens]
MGGMTTEQVQSVGKFLTTAKQLLASAKCVNPTAVFYDGLMDSQKKAVCTLGNIDGRVKLSAKHISMRFEEMSKEERRAVYRGIKELQRLGQRVPTLSNIGDCD